MGGARGLLGSGATEAAASHGVGQGMPALSSAGECRVCVCVCVCVQQAKPKERVAVVAFWFGFPCRVGPKIAKEH